MSERESNSSKALERLKKAAPPSSVPSATEAAQNPETDSISGTTDGSGQPGEPTQPKEQAKQKKEDKPSLKTRFNRWIDNFGGPDAETVERVIYESPARAHQWWKENQEARRQKKLREQAAKEQAEREAAEREALEAELAELRDLFVQQQAQREAEDARRRRLEELEMLGLQQARETKALIKAARELDGTDHIPSATHRPMLQEPGEILTDEQLVARAQERLPELRRLERIAVKAEALQSREAHLRTQAREDEVRATTQTFSLDDVAGATYTPTHLLPETKQNPATGKDRARRLFVTVAGGLFILVGMWGLGWLGWISWLGGPLPEWGAMADGAYSREATYLSMPSWHVIIWPVLWILAVLHLIHVWQPEQLSATRQRATGWYTGGAMTAVAAWFILLRTQPWGLELLAWLAATYCMVAAMVRINHLPARTSAERIATDGFIAMLTGWTIGYAPTALLTAWASWGVLDFLWIPEIVWAVALIVAQLILVPVLTMADRGRSGLALAFAWALAMVVAGRLFGQHSSTTIVLVAGTTAFVIMLATENRRYQISRTERLMAEAE